MDRASSRLHQWLAWSFCFDEAGAGFCGITCGLGMPPGGVVGLGVGCGIGMTRGGGMGFGVGCGSGITRGGGFGWWWYGGG